MSRAAPPIALLIALAAIGQFTMNVVLPAMPHMARSFATSYGVIQLIITVYLASIAVAQLILGPLSDRFGRRPVVIAGVAMLLAGSAVCATAPTVEILIAGRILQAAGGCVGMVIGRAIIRDLHGPERSASLIGYVTVGMVLAPMLAPAVGGVIDQYAGWRWILWLVAAAAALLAVFVHRHLHETHHERPPGSVVRGFVRGGLALFRLPAFWGYAASLSFTSGMFFAFLIGAPYIVVEVMHRSTGEFGAYFIVSSLGYMAGNFATGRYAVRLGPAAMIKAGMACSAIGLAALWLAAGVAHPLAIFGPMTLIALANGLVLPSASATLLSLRPDLAGAASGYSGAIQIGIGALLTLIVGSYQGVFALTMTVAMTASGVLAVVAYAVARAAATRTADRQD